MEKIPDCFYRTSIKALILDEHKRFLLVQEQNGVWELPGGGLDFGEDPHRGLKREIKEEMGLEVVEIESAPSYYLTWQENGTWRSNVIYKTKLKDLNFVSSDECIAIRFFNSEEASRENIYPNVLKFTEMYRKDK